MAYCGGRNASKHAEGHISTGKHSLLWSAPSIVNCALSNLYGGGGGNAKEYLLSTKHAKKMPCLFSTRVHNKLAKLQEGLHICQGNH